MHRKIAPTPLCPTFAFLLPLCAVPSRQGAGAGLPFAFRRIAFRRRVSATLHVLTVTSEKIPAFTPKCDTFKLAYRSDCPLRLILARSFPLFEIIPVFTPKCAISTLAYRSDCPLRLILARSFSCCSKISRHSRQNAPSHLFFYLLFTFSLRPSPLTFTPAPRGITHYRSSRKYAKTRRFKPPVSPSNPRWPLLFTLPRQQRNSRSKL